MTQTYLECIREIRCRWPDKLVSVEVEKPEKQHFEETVQQADTVFYSQHWAQVSSSDVEPYCVR